MKQRFLILCFCALLFSCEHEKNNPLNLQFDKNILDGYFVKSIEFDNLGNTWIGTFKQGLIKYNAGETTLFNSSNTIIRDTAVIYDIAVDSKNNIWIGEEGLVKYDGESFIRYNSENSLIPEDFVSKIEVDSKDNVWFASSRFRQGGLVKYDGSSFNVFTPENSDLPANLVGGIAISNNDDVWLAMNEIVDSSFIVKISGDSWKVFTDEDLGFSPYYFGMISSNSHNELVGCIDYSLSSLYFHEGPYIFIFDGEKSTQFHSNDRSVFGFIFVDKEDRIWYNSSQGLVCYKENGEKLSIELLGDQSVFCINQDPDGNLWIGTSDGISIYRIEL